MKHLLQNLSPDEIYPSIYHIDYDHLWQRGCHALIFDIDNTLGVWGCVEVEPKIPGLFKALDQRGFQLGFLSNDDGARRSALKAQLAQWPVVWAARKPCRKGYHKIIQLLQCAAPETTLIGDQLFTDIWGAKRMKLYAILVKPVNPQTDSYWAKLRRPVEHWILELLAAEQSTQEDPDQCKGQQ